MRTISQRELRNDNAEIMREVEDGETFIVTRRGVPVARLVPWRDDTDLRCDKPATTRTRFSGQPRVSLDMPIQEILDDLRGER